MAHVDAVLKLMTVLTNDSRFEEAQYSGEKEAKAMCDVLERAENRGIEIGIETGMKQGVAQGETRLANLMKILISKNLQAEMQLALSDAAARQRMYQEYGIE